MDIDDAVDWRLIARKAQAEIERLRRALQTIADHYEGERGIDNYQSRVAQEALAADEQNAPTSKCVAEHMGGGRCVGKCLDPKDCCGTPLEQNAVTPVRCRICGKHSTDPCHDHKSGAGLGCRQNKEFGFYEHPELDR